MRAPSPCLTPASPPSPTLHEKKGPKEGPKLIPPKTGLENQGARGGERGDTARAAEVDLWGEADVSFIST